MSKTQKQINIRLKDDEVFIKKKVQWIAKESKLSVQALLILVMKKFIAEYEDGSQQVIETKIESKNEVPF